MHMNWPIFEVQRQAITKKTCTTPLLFIFYITLCASLLSPHQEYNPDQASAPPKKKKPDGAPPTPSTDHVAPPGDRSRLVQEIC